MLEEIVHHVSEDSLVLVSPGDRPSRAAVWHAEQAIDAAPDNGARIAGLSGAEGHVYADGAAW